MHFFPKWTGNTKDMSRITVINHDNACSYPCNKRNLLTRTEKSSHSVDRTSGIFSNDIFPECILINLDVVKDYDRPYTESYGT